MRLTSKCFASLVRAQTADATFELSAGAAQAGVGYGWGEGRLGYGHQSYRFHLYHLARLADLDGTYAEVEVDQALAAAGFPAAIENQRGVLIALRSTTQALHFEPSLSAFA